MDYKCIKCSKIFKKKDLELGKRLFHRCPNCNKLTLMCAEEGKISIINNNKLKLNDTVFAKGYFNKYAEKISFDKENNELIFKINLRKMLKETTKCLEEQIFYKNCRLPKIRFIVKENDLQTKGYNDIEQRIFEMLKQGRRPKEIRQLLGIEEASFILMIQRNKWEGIATLT